MSILDRLFGTKKTPPTAQPREKIAVPAKLQQSPTKLAAGKAPTPPGSATPPPASPDQAQNTKKAPTNSVNWWLDVPEPFQGRDESKTAIQKDLVQNTVNTIGTVYGTLHNWQTVIGPDQVFIQCDVPLDVERSVFTATFKGKTPGIAFTDARSPSPLVRFGLITWEQVCQWKLNVEGVRESDLAAQVRKQRIAEDLAYELKIHVEELINIGRQADAYISGRFLDPTQPRTREIGVRLNFLSAGQPRMMKAAHSAVRRELGDHAARELEVAWNGIGQWQG
jgi:hypothetical protein